MALYNYACTDPDCDTRFDLHRSMRDDAPMALDSDLRRLHRDALALCPKCRGQSKRVQIPPGLKIGAPRHFQNHIHTTGRPLTGDGDALVRSRSRWNAN